MTLIPCTLVHHTGTIIRFTTSQLGSLPPTHKDIRVQLPSDAIVPGHFLRNVHNPNVSGAGVVRYIKQVLGYGERRAALIDVSGSLWRVFNVEDVVEVTSGAHVSATRVRSAKLTGGDLAALLTVADNAALMGARRVEYQHLLRPPGLRQMILSLMGPLCQVEGCGAAQDVQASWGDPAAVLAILEVHHIEAMARTIDHHPRNLCVLCSNHHSLIHGFGPWEVTHDGDDVVLSSNQGSLRIVRNLNFLAAVP